MASPRRLFEAHVNDATHRVTTLELFFDLVYVFAFTQVTAWIAHEHSVKGAAQGLLTLAILWWTWVAWSWVGNHLRADRGAALAGFLASGGSIFAIGLTIRHVWEAEGGSLAPVAFASFYLLIRVLHASVYLWGARGNPVLSRQVLITSAAWIPAASMLLVGALQPPDQRLAWWAGTLAFDLAATWVLAVWGAGWQIRSGGHFAERFGLIVILALGESVVAVGVAADDVELTPHLIGLALLGVGAAVALWWPYFKDVGPTLEEAMETADEKGKVDLARNAYTYLHLPLVAGIILAAAGVEESVLAVDHRDLAVEAAVMLAAGAALYCAGAAALMALVGGTWKWLALAAAFFAVGTTWLWHLDVFLSIGLTAAVLTAVGLATPRARAGTPHSAPAGDRES